MLGLTSIKTEFFFLYSTLVNIIVERLWKHSDNLPFKIISHSVKESFLPLSHKHVNCLLAPEHS